MYSNPQPNHRSRKILTVFSLLVAATLACNLPFTTTPTPAPAQITPTAGAKTFSTLPLPPVVVETSPLPSGTLPMSGVVSLTFDQAMDRGSVEGAIRVDPAVAGSFEWEDDSTVRFVPDQPLGPKTRLTLSVEATARSSEGLNLLRSTSYTFQTPGSLQAVEMLPQPGTSAANPSSLVAVTFNQPIVELGGANSRQAFTIEPAVEGKGYWLNTSTYAFEPDPAMGGGVQYSVHIDPELSSLSGATFGENEVLDWGFSTTPPALLEVSPADSSVILLDAEIRLTFNQPMDVDSVAENLVFRDSAGNNVPGQFTWSESDSVVTFTPDGLLARGNSYHLQLSTHARSRGGTQLLIATSVDYQTIGGFAVRSTTPTQGSPLKVYVGLGSIMFEFNAPLAEGQDLSQLVSISPRPGNLSISTVGGRTAIYLTGSFVEATNYRVTLDGSLHDRWGGTLSGTYTANFLVSDSEPTLQVPILSSGGRTLFAVPGDTSLPGFATNLSTLNLTRAELSLQEFLDTNFIQLTVGAFPDAAKWNQPLTLPTNVSQGIDIQLTPDGSGLQSGFYLYNLNSPEISARDPGFDFGLVVAPVQITLKENRDEVFVWVTDLRSGNPLGNTEVRIYTDNGGPAVSAVTGEDGTASMPLLRSRDDYQGLIAITGEPGAENFGIGYSYWSSGISPWEFGISSEYYQPDLQGYIYTDRPIYRPGQQVYYRAILRTPEDARFTPAGFASATFQLFGGEFDPDTGEIPLLDSAELELSPYGTVAGEFNLPEDAAPGYYSIQLEGHDARIDFQVAEYRKPELDIQVVFDKSDYRSGDDIQARISAEYFFGGAASGVDVRWTLYSQDDYFHIPAGYRTGLEDTRWLSPGWYSGYGFLYGGYITNGEGVTDADGSLTLDFSAGDLAEWLDLEAAHTLVVQAELVDESGQTVTKRGSVKLHPENFYIGIKPESWVARAGESVGFSIQTANWQAEPSPNHDLTAVFQRIDWVQDWSNVQTGEVTFKEQVAEIGSVNFRTDGSGQARIEFTVPEAGSYRLDVRGGQAVSQSLLWAGGAGSVSWPSLPDQHLRIQADQEKYQPGDTASVFIPNPFSTGATALVTVERWGVLRSQVIEISGSSTTIELEIEDGDAPNIYVSTLLLGRGASGRPDFRLGYVDVSVEPAALLLDVNLSLDQARLEPGQTAEVLVQVDDSAGNPVQGEFSIAVVDKAIFALADPNVDPIEEAFYGTQPLGIQTSTPLTAYPGRLVTMEPGMGGGGGGDMAPVAELREDFRDTAYWSGSFETDAMGRAVVPFPVPDNLTTWVVTVRGLTRDTRVGEAATELLVTKDLIVRPVTPRFLVAGDWVQFGAVVNNNTSRALDATVELQANGVILESDPIQNIQIHAGGRFRVNWWATVQDADFADLVFSVRSASLTDAAKPSLGPIPILRYTSPQTFATSGLMTEPGENLEVISLPKSYTPTGGSLRIEMSSTLAGTVISGLEAMENFPLDYSEPVISNLLSNLAVYNLIREGGSLQPDMVSGLQDTIRADLKRLVRLQNSDGGLGWSASASSDLYLSSYGLLALDWADTAGFLVSVDMHGNLMRFVQDHIPAPEPVLEGWELDRLVFANYVLDLNGAIQIEPQDIYPRRELLSPWAKALLALTLKSRDAAAADTLLSDLQGLAVRSATGVNWQDVEGDAWHNFTTPNFNTAVVVYALSRQDPAWPMLADAIRYLVSHRQTAGGWYSSYDTAWVLAALANYIQVTSELTGNFNYSATLNDVPIAEGSAGGPETWSLTRADVPLSQLDLQHGNALRFIHRQGNGRLYYRANLEVGQPVEEIEAVDRGLTISREYTLAGQNCSVQDCPIVNSTSLQDENPVIVSRISLTVPEDMYYVVVKDSIPAGSEIIDLRLNSAPVFIDQQPSEIADPLDPFADGWGWWWFGFPTIYDDHIQWIAEYLPAGTYTLTYQLQPLAAGAFQVLPARAYSYYFPDVEGRSQGMIFTIVE